MDDQIDVEQLKTCQIKILQAVHEFCVNHNISYWLDSGTLLGAIRHKGYIPWDDDIDIGMLRPDYNEFMELFNQSNDRYKFYCIENNSNFLYAHGKVLDTHTVLYEPDKKGNKLSINIDIFVYDNAPENDKKVKKMYKTRDFYRDLGTLYIAHSKPTGNFIRRVIVFCGRFFVRILPIAPSYYYKKMIQNSKKYILEDTGFVGNFTSYAKIKCPKSIFDEFIEVEFEGNMYKAPKRYHEWLTAFYGDYMQLPPEEKRVSHHTFEAYIEEGKEE